MGDPIPMPERALPLSPRSRRIGFVAATFLRLVSATLRWRVVDAVGISECSQDQRIAFLFWHNRIFALPGARQRFFSCRKGAVLSSASRDGEIIAAVMRHFGLGSIRGSSSRRGAAAMRGLVEWIELGYDVAIVPDGPRGPRYRLGPGAVKLAQVTGAKLCPIRIEYGSWWTFKSWDRFRLPKPFTTVTVHFDPLIDIPSELDEAQFEAERQRVERALNPNDETD